MMTVRKVAIFTEFALFPCHKVHAQLCAELVGDVKACLFTLLAARLGL